jgi:hypothetical protein
MAAVLRVQVERMLVLNSGFLSPRIGCGLMLTKVPLYRGNEVFMDCMRTYNYPNVFADKPAVKLFDDNETLMRQFCDNAESNKMALKLNFRAVYAPKDIYLAVDTNKRAAYFLAETEFKLALLNYYRDALPNIAKVLNLTLGGSPGRLTPVGWQNLYDVTNDVNFKLDYAAVERIEGSASVPAVRWRSPVLEIGVNLLNFSDPRTIREGIAGEVNGPENK